MSARASPAAGVPYKFFKVVHPEYDSKYWHRLRALYRGGRALLGDQKLMNEIFPRHRKEREEIYEERCKRAFYVPYAAEIIDHIVAGLSAEPIAMTVGSTEAGGQAELPEAYKAFIKDVSPKGGKSLELNDMVKEQIRNALLLMTGWTLIELPALKDAAGERMQFGDTGAQEKAGALAPYAVVLDAESVIDWEEDGSGELEFVILHTMSAKRLTLQSGRDMVTQTWVIYTRREWFRYEVTHKEDKEPKDEEPIPLVDGGPHTFGRVPIVRLQLADGLWAMNKMEGIAREHFNKRCALAWGELQSLLPELYEFLAPETSAKGALISESQESPSRATDLPRGQGFVQQRGSEDKAQFIGPDPGPFTMAAASCDSLRDELHRVMHQMALSVDNSAASIGRSADSKSQDKAAVAVILTELGKLARKYAEQVLEMVSLARQEPKLTGQWAASGMAKFDAISVADAIEQALSIDMLHLESATFRKRHRSMLMRQILGDDATEEDLKAIDDELDQNVHNESFEPPPAPELASAPPGKGFKPGGPAKPGTAIPSPRTAAGG